MKKKQLLSLLLAAVLVSSSLPISASATSSQTDDGTTQSSDLLENAVWTANGNTLAETTPANFEALAGEGATENSYIHVSSGLASDGAQYIAPADAEGNSIALVANETYTLTFWVRSDAHTGLDSALNQELRVFVANYNADKAKEDKIELTSPVYNAAYKAEHNTTRFIMTDEWTQHSITFSVASPADTVKLTFQRFWMDYDINGFDIDGLSLVDSTGTEILTGTEDKANWVAKSYAIASESKITQVTESATYNSGASEAATNVVTSDALTLLPGTYRLSAKIRSNVFVYDAVTTEETNEETGEVTVTTDYSGSKYPGGTVTVSVAGQSQAYTVYNTWSTHTFDFTVDEATSSLITFDFNKSYPIELDDVTLTPIKADDEISTVNDWTDENGNGITYVYEPGNAAGITEYIHVEAGGIVADGVITGGDGFYYTDTETIYEAGTYRVSFYVRSQDIKNETRNPALRLAVHTTSGPKEIASGYADSYTFIRTTGSTTTRAAEITEDWTYKSYDVALDAADTLKFRIWTFWDAEDAVSFDIAKLSFVNLATGEELIGNGTLSKQDGNQISDPTVVAAKEYYRTDDAASVSADVSLGAGRYTITGYYRLSEIDMTAATRTGSVTVSAGTESAELALTNAWQELSFTVDAASGIDAIELAATESIDFYGVEATLVEKYSDEWTGAEVGDVVRVIDEANNEAGITDYIHVSDFTKDASGVTFSNTSALEAGKTYRLSVWMRTIPQINTGVNAREDETIVSKKYDDGNMDVRIFVNEAYNNGTSKTRREVTNFVLSTGVYSSNIWVQNPGVRAADVTPEWQEYYVEFVSDYDTSKLGITLQRHYLGVDDIVPFDIAKLSLIDVETGKELITADGAWTAYSGSTIKEMSTITYTTTGDTAYVSTDIANVYSGELANGAYILNGNFRITNYDHSKVTVDSANLVTEDNNVATVTVKAMAGDTVAATDTIEIGTEWTTSDISLNITNAAEITDIVIEAPVSVDFYGVELVIDDSAAEADKAAAAEVDALITAIGEVTLESEAAIIAAETAYAGLTDVQKAYVNNLAALEAARATYNELKAAADKAEADAAAAQVVIDAIDAIGEITLEDEEAIIAAEAAYADLTDDQKALVTNYETLTAARATLDELKLVAASVAKVGDTYYATIDEALAADGNITLLANIEDEVAIAKVVSIIKNGFTANVVAATGYELIETDDAYNVYTAVEKFDLSGVTMTLGSSLSLDFAINTANLTGTDNYAKMTIVYADGSEPDTIIVPQSEWTEFSGKIYTAKFTGMAAKQMNDVVT
ncbi:MAG: hypothetical protein IJY93_02145, partial [Clostridia bacterium]|nr:hypothetical protein [Clostridia bacterium]